MQSQSPVEIADRYSRRRAILVAAATAIFLVVQLFTHPLFAPDVGTEHDTKIALWVVNTLVLLALLATGGGLAKGRQIRALLNDEVARSHYRTAVVVGFWVAMTTAMGLYFVPGSERLTARETVYLIVTPSIGLALLTFSWLEVRAHRDA